MPNFKISPVDASEIEALTVMGGRAFLNDELRLAVFPPSRIDPENLHEEFNFRVKRLRKRLKSGGGHFFKCTDEDAEGRIVALASWFEPGGNQWKGDPAQDGGAEEEALPKCMEPSMYHASVDAMKGARERILKGDHNLWYLGSLATDPDYQGKGLGRMMMQWGIEQADRDGLRIYLEATPMGRTLYEKLGFETVEVLTFPGVMVRENGPYKLSVMLKMPQKKTE